MSNKSLQYAEEKLGVHKVYEEAEAARRELDEFIGDLDKAQDARRKLTEAIADREADLIAEERGKHADLSAAAFDQHYKGVKRKDLMLTELRVKLQEVLGDIQGLEYDTDMLRHTIRIKCARMEQLGGYLNFLAAVKQAEQPTKPTKPEEQT